MQEFFTRKLAVVASLLALLWIGQAGVLAGDSHAALVTPVQLNDYTSQVMVSISDFENTGADVYKGYIKIKSKGQKKSTAIGGTIAVVLENLPDGVTQTNANGSIDGLPIP